MDEDGYYHHFYKSLISDIERLSSASMVIQLVSGIAGIWTAWFQSSYSKPLCYSVSPYAIMKKKHRTTFRGNAKRMINAWGGIL